MSSYLISVSQGTGCYRHIRIAASATLYRLHKAILDAFEFEDDHEHAFFMDNRLWSEDDCFVSSKLHPEDRVTRRCKLENLDLCEGDRFKYLFDYGEEWTFQCRVLRILDEATAKPVIVKSVGEAPWQYPEWDDDDEVEPGPDPQEIEKMLAQLPLDKETIHCLRQYFDAAANLYGVIPVSKLLDIYNSQNEPVPAETFYRLAQILRCEENEYFVLSRQEVKKGECGAKPEEYEVIADYLLAYGVEHYFEFVRDQGKKPYKILPREEFLCYAQVETFPGNLQSDAMLNYLRKRKNDLSFPPEKVCQMIRLMLNIGYEMKEALEQLAKNGLQFRSIEDFDTFMRLYQDMSNHTRMQVNRGFTPFELIRESGGGPLAKARVLENQISIFNEPGLLKNGQADREKVGRNDPCPCGSGLKYKMCCGKA